MHRNYVEARGSAGPCLSHSDYTRGNLSQAWCAILQPELPGSLQLSSPRHCRGLDRSPQISGLSKPQDVILFRNRALVNVISWDHTELGWILIPTSSVLTRREDAERYMWWKGPCGDRGRDWSEAVISQKLPRTPKKSQGKILQKDMALLMPYFRLLASKLWE